MDVEEELKEGELPEGMHVDIPEEDVVAVVDPLIEEDGEKEDNERGMFGEDKAFEEQILDPYGDKDHY